MKNKLVKFSILVELVLIYLLLTVAAYGGDMVTLSNIEKTYCGRLAVYEMTVDNQLDTDLQALVIILIHAGLSGMDHDVKLVREVITAKSKGHIRFTSALPKSVVFTKVELNSVADMKWRWYECQ